MSKRKILGWYIVNGAGEQVAFRTLRRDARKIAVDYSKRFGGLYYTQPEYSEVL